MNGHHNHPTLGKALHNAVQSLTLNVFSVCYLWPTSGHHCHILLDFHNDHDDDDDKDDDGRALEIMMTIMMMIKMMMKMTTKTWKWSIGVPLSLMTVLRFHPRELTHTAANDVHRDHEDDDDDDDDDVDDGVVDG